MSASGVSQKSINSGMRDQAPNKRKASEVSANNKQIFAYNSNNKFNQTQPVKGLEMAIPHQ